MAYRDSTTASGNGTTGGSVAVPAGVAADDIVILISSIDASTAVYETTDFPAGFTRFTDANVLADGQSIGIAWKRLTGADSGSYTIGTVKTGQGADWVCQAIAFSGRHTTDPPVISTDSIDSTLSNTPQAPSANGLTYVEGDDVAWACAPDVDTSGVFTAWSVVPTNFTSRENTENAWTTLLLGSRDNAPAGASGSITGEFTHSNLSGWGCWQVRIPVASGGGAQTLTATVQTLAKSAAAAVLVAGAVTLAAGIQALGLSASAPSVSSGAITVAAGSQIAGLSAPDATIVPTITLAAGSQMLAVVAPAPTVSAGATTATAEAATLALSANATISATISLTGGVQTLGLSVPDVSVTSGAVTIAAGAQTLALSAPDPVTASGASSLAAGTQILALIAPAATISAGGGGQTLTADAQIIALIAPSPSVSSGAVTVQSGSQVLSLVAPDTTITATISLAAGGQTLGLSAPDATVGTGAVTLSANDQTIGLSASSATVSTGAVTIGAGAQVLALVAPDASVVQASNQTLSADAAALVLIAPSAEVSVAGEPRPAQAPTSTTPTGAGVWIRRPPAYTVIGVERDIIDVNGEIVIAVSVEVDGRCTVTRQVSGGTTLDIGSLAVIAAARVSSRVSVTATISVTEPTAIGTSSVCADVHVRVACLLSADTAVQCTAVTGVVMLGEKHLYRDMRRLAEEAALIIMD